MSPEERGRRQAYEKMIKQQVSDTEQQRLLQIEKDTDQVRQLISQNKLQEAYDILITLQEKYQKDSVSLDNFNSYILDVCTKMIKTSCVDERLAVFQDKPMQYARMVLITANFYEERGNKELAKNYYKKALDFIDINGGQQLIDQINSVDAENQYSYNSIKEKAL